MGADRPGICQRSAWGSDMDPAPALRGLLVRSKKNTLRGLLAMLDITAEELAAVAPAAATDVLPDTRLDGR